MNVMKWVLLSSSSLKSDLQFPEFLDHLDRESSLPLAWAIGDQLISGFNNSALTQALSIEVSDPRSHVDYFFEVHPELSLVQVVFLVKAPLFAEIFDANYFFSRWGKGQLAATEGLMPVISALPEELLLWIHHKDLRAPDLSPLKTLPASRMNFVTKAFVETRASKSEGVQILEFVTDLCLMGLSEEQILKAFGGSASATLSQLKILRYPQTVQRDLESQQKLKFNWPKNIQARYQRRGDKAGFDLQVFVGSSAELKKTVTYLEKVVEEWKSLSQDQ